MKQPLVSIITPSYNQAAFLEETLHSVIEQNYPSVEYLVVDGGSTDGSVDIIKRHEKAISWWVSQKDKGQAEAINKGFQRAGGEIIGWLNSDDTYQPDVLREVVDVFRSDPTVALVYGDVRAIDETGGVINHIRYGDWNLGDLMEFNIIGQPSVFFRREALQRAGFLDPQFHLLLDHHLWLRITQMGRMAHVPREWACARFHPEAKNISSASLFGEEAYRILAWMENDPGLREDFQQRRRKCVAGAHRINARYLLDGGQPGESLKAYWKSFTAYPPTALKEWHRILYCFPAMIGLTSPRSAYNRWRKKKNNLNPRT
jgi:glycosyltransferase involved in cell wall biosynthesis